MPSKRFYTVTRRTISKPELTLSKDQEENVVPFMHFMAMKYPDPDDLLTLKELKKKMASSTSSMARSASSSLVDASLDREETLPVPSLYDDSDPPKVDLRSSSVELGPPLLSVKECPPKGVEIVILPDDPPCVVSDTKATKEEALLLQMGDLEDQVMCLKSELQLLKNNFSSLMETVRISAELHGKAVKRMSEALDTTRVNHTKAIKDIHGKVLKVETDLGTQIFKLNREVFKHAAPVSVYKTPPSSQK